MSETILQGDAIEKLRHIREESINTCVTSPPYYNLRDYGEKGQIGREGAPEEFVEKLVGVFREVRRVLRPDGTLWVNIGDSYATRSGAQPPTNTRNSCGHTQKRPPSVYKYKDLIGIPWLLAFALRADGWYLRQDIVWNKTNCMPESVRDRCTKSHEYIFLLSKSERYYFDTEAICEPIAASKITERAGGKEVQRWALKSSHADNHYLDCEVYAAAAADVLEVRSLFLKNQERAEEQTPKPTPPKPAPAPEENWIQQNENWV